MPVHIRQRSTSVMTQVDTSVPVRDSYDASTGQIALPPSPPLMSWDPEDSPKARPSLPKRSTDSLLSTKLAQAAPLVWRSPPTSRPSVPRPKSLLRTVAYGAFTLAVVTLILRLIPSDSQAGISKRLPRYRSFLSATRQDCHPYSAEGELQVDLSDPDLNTWHPRDTSCQPPRLFQQLRSLNNRYSSGSVHASDFDWVRGKTVLLIGDSISREHVENFCQLMGEDAEVIRPSHQWAPNPAPLRAPSRAKFEGSRQHRSSRQHRLSGRSTSTFRDSGRPRMCYVPHLDFLLLSVLHYGLDQEDYWSMQRHPMYTAPGVFEHRISDVVRPLLANIRADGRPSAPDYIEFAPGTWDLARFAEQDAQTDGDANAPLSAERVAWFKHRLLATAERIQAAFPGAQTRIWRTLPYALDQSAEVDYFMDKTAAAARSNSSGTDVPYFAHARVDQMNDVMRSLARKNAHAASTPRAPYQAPGSGFSVNEFGRVLKGYRPHQTDRLHGEPVPGGYVWADMMLYELRKASEQNVAARRV
ncbi:hypothetical protein JCM8202_002655 [Rhodotorula sphaerocarpa]